MPPRKPVEKTVETTPPRRILVHQGEKAFVITVPEDAKTTFGPWTPPGMRSVYGGSGDSVGTLRVYGRTEKHVLGVFAGVTGFRDLSLEYSEVEPELLTEKVSAKVIFDGIFGTREIDDDELPFESRRIPASRREVARKHHA